MLQPDQPKTKALRKEVLTALPDAQLVYIKVLDEGFHSEDPHKHSTGEYSIEMIVKKPE